MTAQAVRRCRPTLWGHLRQNTIRGLAAAQLRYTCAMMKSAILPSVRVDPALRASVESLLGADETLSGFVENSVRQAVMRRQNQAEFIARGLASLDNARRTGEYVDADTVLEKLEQKLAAAKATAQSKRQAPGP